MDTNEEVKEQLKDALKLWAKEIPVYAPLLLGYDLSATIDGIFEDNKSADAETLSGELIECIATSLTSQLLSAFDKKHNSFEKGLSKFLEMYFCDTRTYSIAYKNSQEFRVLADHLNEKSKKRFNAARVGNGLGDIKWYLAVVATFGLLGLFTLPGRIELKKRTKSDEFNQLIKIINTSKILADKQKGDEE